MATLHNHNLFPLASYWTDLPQKAVDFQQNGHYYAGRQAVLTEADDTVQVHPELRPHYELMAQHLGNIGISVAQNVAYDTSPAYGRNFDGPVSVYYFSELFHAVRPDAARRAAAERFDNKNEFIGLAEELGLPVPPTQCVNAERPLAMAQVRYPSFYKPITSSNGNGLALVADQPELERVLPPPGVAYQVQRLMSGYHPASAQYIEADGQAHYLASTEQVISEKYRHLGNRFPAQFDFRHVTDPMAQAMVDHGLKGVFGLDLLVNERRQALLLESNPRFTGASPGIFASRKLEVTRYLSKAMSTSFTDPEALHAAIEKDPRVAYDPERKVGAVILNNARLNMVSPAPETVLEAALEQAPDYWSDQLRQVELLHSLKKQGDMHPTPVVEVLLAGAPEQQQALLVRLGSLLIPDPAKSSIVVPVALAA